MTQPEPRVTAWWYVCTHDLPQYSSLGWLLGIGLRAARLARWEGLEEQRIWEGPYLVHAWPERIFARVIAELAAAPVPPDVKIPRYDPDPETRDAGWGEGGVPWDGDDIRPD